MSNPSPYRGSLSPACPSYVSPACPSYPPNSGGASYSNSSFFSQSSSSGGSYRKKNFIANLIGKGSSSSQAGGSGEGGRRSSLNDAPSSAALLANIPPQMEPTPLPVKKLVCVLAVFFAESMSITILYPFVAFMVRDFHVSDNDADLGYYAGLIESAFFICQCISNPFWGSLSDKIGRRPVLLMGLIGNIVCILLFGVSPNLIWAVTSRGLNGLMNGNFGVIKVYLREITDNSNQASAFALLGFTWGIGGIMGPFIGGYLANPSKHCPYLFPPGSLFDRMPYLFPCLVSAGVAFLGLLYGLLYMQETHQGVSKQGYERVLSSTGEERNARLLNRSGSSSNASGSISGRVEDHEMTPLVESADFQEISLADAFFTKKVLVSMVMYAILAYLCIVADQIFPIWALQSVEDHGIGFDTIDISYVMIPDGIALIIWQLFVYKILDAKFGTIKVLRFSLFFLALGVAAPPYFVHIVEYRGLFWFLMCSLFFLRGCAIATVLTASSILVNNSCSSHIGAINGIVASAAAFMRAMGPITGCSLLAWSQSNGLSNPFDYHFMFLLLGFLTFLMFFCSFVYDRSMDQRHMG